MPMDFQRIEKRGCHRSGGGISLSLPPYNNNMEEVLEALLESSESHLLAESLERLMEKRVTDVEKNYFLEKSLDLGQRLQEAANRLTRQRATDHNSLTWPLTHDLTVKVFSLLGTQTLCYAAATCTLFNKSAMDPVCYADIDLTSSDFKIISNMTVSKMVQRAGLFFRSLKLGISGQQGKSSTSSFKLLGSTVDIHLKSADALDRSWHYRNYKQDRSSFMLTRSCLETLSSENGMVGSMLKTLHLFNITEIDTKALCGAISSCPSLSDLELVDLHVQLKSVLSCLSSHCHFLERLCCQSSKTGRVEGLRSYTCTQFLTGCPKISSLSLKGFKLSDQKLDALLKGFCNLKFVDFSTASNLTGTFLRSLAHTGNELQLQTLILRDCMHLKEGEVDTFLFALCSGECKYLQYLDISNKDGLAVADWFERQTSPSVEGIARLRSERPQFHLVAEFPAEKSDIDSMLSSFDDSDESEAVGLGTPSSISMSEFSSESTYSSDTSSDSEENG
ncbi:F-box protein At4g02760 isoform X2 [Cryptomeria japonica]|uniref:F-box protein At4g02760 isoform X2 n=1 Tax=Cryptomeria japonica TaxID=3369 RepID=UPI0025AB9BC9|nr:F-box protein At4g02760 isoform X2 [Cryptomeria japonica]